LPGCETAAAAQVRAVSAVKAILTRHPDETVLISGHGSWIGLLLNYLNPEFGFEGWRKMQQPDIFRLARHQLDKLTD